MAKKIKKIHDDILDIVKKSGVGVFVSHEQIDNYLHRAQLDKFVELIGSEKEYQPGRPIPPISYPSTLKIHADLRNFITKPATKTLAADGTINLPERTSSNPYLNTDFSTFDWVLINSLKTNLDRTIDLLFEHEVADRLISKIDPPDLTYPVAVIYEDILQVYPKSEYNIKLSFLRIPLPPEYNYTKDVNGREVSYNDAGSTDLEWPETVHTDIIARALSYISAPLKDVFLNQFSENKFRNK